MPSLAFRRRMLAGAASLLVGPALVDRAVAQTPSFSLVVREQKFEPAELIVPSGQKFELHVTNADAVNIEFESSDLRREKVIARGQTATLYLGPLRPGRYEVFDDFRRQVRGVIVAK